MFKAIYETILTLVYPQECRICGNSVESSSEGIACSECWKQVRIFSGAEVLCAKCGAYQGSVGQRHSVSCGQCTEHAYDRAFAAGIYEHALAATILHQKKDPHLCGRSRDLLLSAWMRAGLSMTTLIIPVPLSRKRFLERGFNQAEILASFVARQSRIPVSDKFLARRSHTPMHRAAMDRKAREATVRNAFEINNSDQIEGACILLVDDVFTSGATVSRCAEILKKNGAERVDVLTLARAV